MTCGKSPNTDVFSSKKLQSANHRSKMEMDLGIRGCQKLTKNLLDNNLHLLIHHALRMRCCEFLKLPLTARLELPCIDHVSTLSRCYTGNYMVRIRTTRTKVLLAVELQWQISRYWQHAPCRKYPSVESKESKQSKQSKQSKRHAIKCSMYRLFMIS